MMYCTISMVLVCVGLTTKCYLVYIRGTYVCSSLIRDNPWLMYPTFLFTCESQPVQTGEVLQLLTRHLTNPVLPEVQRPKLGQAGDVAGDVVQVIVVQGQVLQHGGALEQPRRQHRQSVVVQGQRAQGAEAGKRGWREVTEDVVGQEKDVEVDQRPKTAGLNAGEAVVLQIEDLEVVLRGEEAALQPREAVEAQVESHELLKAGEDVLGEEVAGDLIVRDVEEQQVVQPCEDLTGEQRQ